MNEPPRRRLLDRLGGTPSLLAGGCTLVGDIETRGALMCSAHVRGNGRISGELSLGAEASWEGDVWAYRAAIAGQIHGSLTVTDKLEIAASAVIRGRVAARSIALARGATIDGEVTVTGEEPVIEFEEKRHTSSA